MRDSLARVRFARAILGSKTTLWSHPEYNLVVMAGSEKDGTLVYITGSEKQASEWSGKGWKLVETYGYLPQKIWVYKKKEKEKENETRK